MTYSGGLLPLDVPLLKQLPAEGTMLAEYIPLGTSVRALANRLDGITNTQVAGRMSALKFLGYVTSVRILPVSKGLGWQRTAKADALLEQVAQVGVMAAIEAANDALAEEDQDSPADQERQRQIEAGSESVGNDNDEKEES